MLYCSTSYGRHNLDEELEIKFRDMAIFPLNIKALAAGGRT